MIVYVCEELVPVGEHMDQAEWIIRHIYQDFDKAKQWASLNLYNREYYAVKVE